MSVVASDSSAEALHLIQVRTLPTAAASAGDGEMVGVSPKGRKGVPPEWP